MIIDIHSHILPGVDDGADTIENALLMLKMAALDGITHIILTPHLLIKGNLINFDNVKNVFGKLCGLVEESIPVKLYLGCEAPLIINKLADAILANIVPTLAGSNFVLVEFYQNSMTFSSEYIIMELLNKGYRPIIAHPERCTQIHKTPKVLKKLVDSGVFLQINADSIMGMNKQMSKFTRALLKEGLVSFIASDSHNIAVRKPLLSNCMKYVASELGTQTAEDIFFNNPSKIIGL